MVEMTEKSSDLRTIRVIVTHYLACHISTAEAIIILPCPIEPAQYIEANKPSGISVLNDAFLDAKKYLMNKPPV